MNRKNKGFTLIELLAVIILISVITLIAVPSIRYASKKIKAKEWKAKEEVIQVAAQEYGDDNKEAILYATNVKYMTDSSNSNRQYPCISVTVQTLLNNGYLTKDTDSQTEDIKDPRDDKSILNKTLTIYIKNNRAYGVFSTSTSNLCQ